MTATTPLFTIAPSESRNGLVLQATTGRRKTQRCVATLPQQPCPRKRLSEPILQARGHSPPFRQRHHSIEREEEESGPTCTATDSATVHDWGRTGGSTRAIHTIRGPGPLLTETAREACDDSGQSVLE